jgi:hypothetical protein
MTDFIKRALADYIIDALADCADLDVVKLFIRGGTPMPVPQHQYPFSEVIIGQEDEGDDMTGNVYGQTYVGLITFNVQLAQTATGDWLNQTGDRRAVLPSYDAVEELVHYAREELQHEAHCEMGGLTVGAEKVTKFALTGPRVYGLEAGARPDNYTNFGSIPFVVETERMG